MTLLTSSLSCMYYNITYYGTSDDGEMHKTHFLWLNLTPFLIVNDVQTKKKGKLLF
jgi:hypothetical protein